MPAASNMRKCTFIAIGGLIGVVATVPDTYLWYRVIAVILLYNVGSFMWKSDN